MMLTTADLKARFTPYFLEAPAFDGFENVSLISNDRQVVTINACIFASVNPWCYDLLRSVPDQSEDFHLVTELPKAALVAFKILATTGKGTGFMTEDDKAALDCLALRPGTFGLSTTRHQSLTVEKVSKETQTPAETPYSHSFQTKVSLPGKDLHTEALDIDYPMKEEIDFYSDDDFNADLYITIPEPLVKEDECEIDNVAPQEEVKTEDKSDQDDKAEDIPNRRLRSRSKPNQAKTDNKEVHDSDNMSDEDYEPPKEWPKQKPNTFQYLKKKKRKRHKPYQCSKCPKGYFAKDSYMQHVRRHTAKSEDDLWFCLRCTDYVAFKTTQELSKHTQEHHQKDMRKVIDYKTELNADLDVIDNRKVPRRNKTSRSFHFPTDESKRRNLEYQCDQCAREFRAKNSYLQHVKRHSAKSEEDRWFCLRCPDYVAFRTLPEMKQHVRDQHEGEVYQCEHCTDKTKIFKMPHLLRDHVQKYHLEVRTFNCLSCGKEFPTMGEVREHQRNAGTNHDGKCRLCPDFEAKTWAENLKHFESVHQGKRQYKCGSCTEHFLSEHQYATHRRKQCGDRKVKSLSKEICPFCAKNISKSYMDMHVKNHHGSHSIPCEYKDCKILIKHPDVVAYHVQQHHTEQTCQVCGKTFKGKKHFQLHFKRSHVANNLRPHICKICGKGFGDNTRYNDHMNVHTGAKPHKCRYCGKCFASTGTMRGHERSVHEGIKRK